MKMPLDVAKQIYNSGCIFNHTIECRNCTYGDSEVIPDKLFGNRCHVGVCGVIYTHRNSKPLEEVLEMIKPWTKQPFILDEDI
jgi:hypothetical protein